MIKTAAGLAAALAAATSVVVGPAFAKPAPTLDCVSPGMSTVQLKAGGYAGAVLNWQGVFQGAQVVLKGGQKTITVPTPAGASGAFSVLLFAKNGNATLYNGAACHA